MEGRAQKVFFKYMNGYFVQTWYICVNVYRYKGLIWMIMQGMIF